jgi:DHA1 family bicyclomycin/chloramphenicol resistance-like MFS transporter
MRPAADSDPGALVWLLGALAALGPLSIDMYLPSFPDIARTFGTDVADVELTLAVYLGGLAFGQFVYGPLSDRFGRRAPLIGGLALYALGSLACAAAPTLAMLTAARLLQALGGCAGMVISRAVVRDRFDEAASARLYSSLFLVMGVAPILAPLLGGQLLLVGGWRSIFLVLGLFGVAVLALLARWLPESLHADGRVVSSPGEIGTASLSVLRNRRFLCLGLASGALQAAMFAYISGSPFVFIELLGVPPERYGLLFGANAIGLIACSQVNRWLAPRFGVLHVLRAAVLVGCLAFAALAVVALNGGGLWALMPPIFIGVSSLGLVLPNITAAVMSPFGEKAGLASALLGTLQMVCAATAAVAVSALSNGTALPMAGVMCVCGVLALILVAVDRYTPRYG